MRFLLLREISFHVDSRIGIEERIRIGRQEHRRDGGRILEYVGARDDFARDTSRREPNTAQHRRLFNRYAFLRRSLLRRKLAARFTYRARTFEVYREWSRIKTGRRERKCVYFPWCFKKEFVFQIAIRRGIRISPAISIIHKDLVSVIIDVRFCTSSPVAPRLSDGKFRIGHGIHDGRIRIHQVERAALLRKLEARMRFVATVADKIIKHLERHFLRLVRLGADTRAVDVFEVGESRTRRNPRMVHRRGIPRAGKDELVALPVVDIGLRQAEGDLPVLGDVGTQEQFIRPGDVEHVVLAGAARPDEYGNRRPAEILVLPQLHDSAHTAHAAFLEAILLLPGQGVCVAFTRRIALRVRPSPATGTDHV